MMNFISDCLEEVSYIRPRDPSIQNFNRNNLQQVRRNMQFSMNDELSKIEEHKNIEQNRVQIYLRVKENTNKSENYIIHENDLIYKVAEHDVRKTRESIYKKITFSKIFGMVSKQSNIFEDIVKIKVFEFINGKDSSILTYGTQGSGRSFTTVGTAEEPGLLIRTLEYLFKTLPELPEISTVKPTPDGKILKLTPNQVKSELALRTSILKSQSISERLRNVKLYQAMQEKLRNEPFASLEQLAEVSIGVWVSFAEIHNEEIFDLLQGPVNSGKKRLRIALSNGKPYITDLTHICVSNGSEAFQVYQYGVQKMKCTKANVHSNPGRATSIFTIKIAHSLSNRDTKFISAFNICNLANVMDNSLMILGKCIATLKNFQEHPNQKHIIPYRDSKLTQLFHRACLGLQDFCIIVNINFSSEKLKETLNVLNFSALSKETISKSAVLEFIALNSEYSIELDRTIKELKEAIHERETYYENLVKNKSRSLELEIEHIMQVSDEILRESKEYGNIRKKNLEEEYERRYQMELCEMRIKLRRKIERKKKRETQMKVKYLKEEYQRKENELKKAELEISNLSKKLNEAKNSILRIENNKKLIAELEEFVEKVEIDSFISNEIECEGDIEKSQELDENIEKNEIDSFTSNEIECEEDIEKSQELDENIEKNEIDSFTSNAIECEGDIEKSQELDEFVEKNEIDPLLSNEIDECEGNIETSQELDETAEKYEIDSFILNEKKFNGDIDQNSESNEAINEINPFISNETKCERDSKNNSDLTEILEKDIEDSFESKEIKHLGDSENNPDLKYEEKDEIDCSMPNESKCEGDIENNSESEVEKCKIDSFISNEI